MLTLRANCFPIQWITSDGAIRNQTVPKNMGCPYPNCVHSTTQKVSCEPICREQWFLASDTLQHVIECNWNVRIAPRMASFWNILNRVHYARFNRDWFLLHPSLAGKISLKRSLHTIRLYSEHLIEAYLMICSCPIGSVPTVMYTTSPIAPIRLDICLLKIMEVFTCHTTQYILSYRWEISIAYSDSETEETVRLLLSSIGDICTQTDIVLRNGYYIRL